MMMSTDERPRKDLYLNKPQQLVYLVGANVTLCIWGRGTGKSEGVIAPWLIDKVFKMPRSKGIIIGPTYQHILSNTLPQVLEMWERMGYYRDVHFVVGRKPNPSWGWPIPYAAPLNSKHTIFWFNGACQVLVSQDRTHNSAGPSVDYIVGDEAKHLDFIKLQETFQTNRGNRQYFGHLSCHHALLFCTDMPTSPKSNWLFEYEQLVDHDAIQVVLGIQCEIILLQQQLDKEVRKTYKARIEKKIKEYENIINFVRMGGDTGQGLVYFSEFSTLENLEIVGIGYIKDQKRNLPDFKFRASILNERVKKIEGMFYPMLDEDFHYYYAFNYTKIDQFNFDFKKITRHAYHQDADVLPGEPLSIALDYNASINSMSIGQPNGKKFKTLNFLFVVSPLMLKDVVEKFIKYYKHHPTREVNYYFDHTAVGSDAMMGDYSFSDQVIELLEQAGWIVNQYYIGQAPGYEDRFEMFNNALRGEKGLPLPVFNRHNCESLITSMENARTRQGKSGFELDKRSERDPNILPQHATHAQESWGTLFWGIYNHIWNNDTTGFDDTVMM